MKSVFQKKAFPPSAFPRIGVPAIVWVATLYFVQGLPNAIVDLVAPVALKDLNFENSAITFIAAWAYLPWVLKALWSPLVDAIGLKRNWIAGTQFFGAILLVALGISLGFSVPAVLVVATLFAIAVISATHDIAADGFYMLAFDEQKQALYSGARSVFFRLSQIFAKGVVVIFAGTLIAGTAFLPKCVPATAWQIVFVAVAILTAIFAIFHWIVLPFPPADAPAVRGKMREIGEIGEMREMGNRGNDRGDAGLAGTQILKNFAETFRTFFQKKSIAGTILFLLIFRLGEVQLSAISPLFLKDEIAAGGLALDNLAVGTLYGTFGVAALLAGGIIGGIVVAKTARGLAFWLLPMAAALNLPDFIYVAFAHWQICDFNALAAGIVVEQFGYGFGFTGYMLFMLKFSAGTRHAVAHYAICTAFMALSAFLPKIWAGTLQEFLGYELYFWWAILCTIPGFLVAAWGAKKLKGGNDEHF